MHWCKTEDDPEAKLRQNLTKTVGAVGLYKVIFEWSVGQNRGGFKKYFIIISCAFILAPNKYIVVICSSWVKCFECYIWVQTYSLDSHTQLFIRTDIMYKHILDSDTPKMDQLLYNNYTDNSPYYFLYNSRLNMW